MNKINITYYKSPIGEIVLGSYDDRLCLADWRYRKKRSGIDDRIQKTLKAEYLMKSSDIIEQAIEEFEEYFRGKRKVFDTPLLLIGTEFQKSVWNKLVQIPYGTTSTYLDLAKSIENEKAVRAVGFANGANAISIMVPCHRIIGSNGDLVGYAGGLDAKKKLLKLEHNNTIF